MTGAGCRVWILWAMAPFVCAAASGVPAQSQSPTSITFATDIAPILWENCAACHHPGGSGPFDLLSYEDARKRARQIAEVTARRFMPPWLPDVGSGPFEGERRLTPAQIEILAAWAEQGAPEGDASRLGAPPEFPADWELGPPDLVLPAADAFLLPAEGRDVFRNFVFPIPVDGVRYVEAMEILPGNKRLVHHANVLLDRSGEGRRRDAEEPGPGFSGMDLALESERFEPQTHFLFWKPGARVHREAPGMAWPVDGKTDLILNMHMQPSGRVEEIRPSIGLYFSDQPATRYPMLIQLENDRAIDIPPGEKSFLVTDEFTLPVGVEVLGVYPHAHYLGQQLEAWATLPDGSHRGLIKINDWDFNWQGVYRYRSPLSLPPGARISMRYRYDNSAGNPQNPYHPPRRITAGNQSTDEMAHLWLQLLPAGREDQFRLQEALMRHRLERYPDDAVARANLGSVLQLRGELEAAIAEYQRAVEIRPDDAVSLNNLGAALQASGRTGEAIPYLRRAVAARPGYASARFNLGNSLMVEEQPREAASHFLAVLQEFPEDFEVHVRLGYLYSMLGQNQESIDHYRKALQTRPADPDVLNDLGTVLAASGRFGEARTQFESSLRARPEQAEAHANLGLLLARTGDPAPALAHLQLAVEIEPANADVRNNLGILLAQMGRLEEAAEQFQRAVELAPAHAAAAENLRRARAQIAARPR